MVPVSTSDLGGILETQARLPVHLTKKGYLQSEAVPGNNLKTAAMFTDVQFLCYCVCS